MLVLSLLLLWTMPFLAAFSPGTRFLNSPTLGLLPLFDSKEEEIARLEDQLLRLKEEEDGAEKTFLEANNERTTARARKLEKMQGKEMILSEQELYDGGFVEEENSGGGNIAGLVGAVLAVVGIIAFAQIPIGQENLSRYSATGSAIIKTIDLGDLNPDRKASFSP